jgi:ParB/RepB/Spo0J family partition protein
MIIKIPVSDVLSNPYRNRKDYEINEEKVQQLIASFKASGEWPGIIVRKNRDGDYESAFGEHRKAAHARLYGKNSEIEVIVLKLDDATMLRFMANENSETWTGAFLNEMETVEQTVKAFSRGEIQLAKANKQSGNFRCAPSFISGGGNCGAGEPQLYNAKTVAQFLGWMEPSGVAQKRVEDSVAALEFIERGILTRRHFTGLGHKQAEALLSNTRAVQKNVKVKQSVYKEEIREAYEEAEEAKQRVATAKTAEQRRKAERNQESAEERRKEAEKLSKDIETLPERAAEKISKALQTGKVGYERSYEVIEPLIDNLKPPRKLPFGKEFVDGLCREIANFIDPLQDKERAKKINSAIEFRSELSGHEVARLARVLTALSGRCLRFAERLTSKEQQLDHAAKTLPER